MNMNGEIARLMSANQTIWVDNFLANSTRRLYRLYSSFKFQLFSNSENGPPAIN